MISHSHSAKDRNRDKKQRKADARIRAVNALRPLDCVCQTWPFSHASTCRVAQRGRKWVMFLRMGTNTAVTYTKRDHPTVIEQLKEVLDDTARQTTALGHAQGGVVSSQTRVRHLLDWINKLDYPDARVEFWRRTSTEATKGTASWMRNMEVYGTQRLGQHPQPLSLLLSKYSKRVVV